MGTLNVWENVEVKMQSALAAAVDISAISKAAEAVVSATGHGLDTGDYVLLTVAGMRQLNNVVGRVTVVDVDSFRLDGEDSNGFSDFTTGTFQKITYGVDFSTLADISVSGGEDSDIEWRTVHTDDSTSIPGSTSPLVYSFNSSWDPGDAALQALRAASRTKTQRAFLFRFPSGAESAFNGYPAFRGAPTGQAGQVVTSPLTIRSSGVPSGWAA